MNVRLYAVKRVRGKFVPTSCDRATEFRVYIGPLDNMRFTASFASHTDAYNWAEECAICNECSFDDFSYKEEA